MAKILCVLFFSAAEAGINLMCAALATVIGHSFSVSTEIGLLCLISLLYHNVI